MADFSENTLLPIAGGEVKQPAELDDHGWFLPFIPEVRPGPKPAQKPKPSGFQRFIDKTFADLGCPLSPTKTKPETGPSAPADSGDGEAAQPGETAGAPVEAPPPPPRVATATALVTWIKLCLLARTNLSEDAAELIAFWVISTWFQDVLTVFPCLGITGSAHDASRVLHVLKTLCAAPVLLAGFRRSDLNTLSRCWTVLISEPNLDKRTAALLSNLTEREFRIVDGGSMSYHSRSTAIYLGENPETHRILNSIHLHLAPTNAEPAASPRRLQEMMEHLSKHLSQYRRKYLSHVQNWMWTRCDFSSETATMATALGGCLVEAPELRQRLVALLKTRDSQRRSELSNTNEATVLEATWTLSRDGREQAYAREIAVEANRIRETRGERARLSPEKVGHSLKKLGLRTHALSQAGHGLTFDKPTLARMQRLAALYVMEDPPVETENLHSPQDKESKKVE